MIVWFLVEVLNFNFNYAGLVPNDLILNLESWGVYIYINIYVCVCVHAIVLY